MIVIFLHILKSVSQKSSCTSGRVDQVTLFFLNYFTHGLNRIEFCHLKIIHVYVVIMCKKYIVYITSICTEKCALLNASHFIAVKAKGTGPSKLQIVIVGKKIKG